MACGVTMIQLYHASGSTECTLVGIPVPREDWANVRHTVCRLLRARDAYGAAQLLETYPFDLYEGANSFGDEFSLLYLSAPLERYVEFAEQAENPEVKMACREIALAMWEEGQFYIRFIVVGINTDDEAPAVSRPSLAITSDAVERAMADCEQLIHSRGATSGVDRIHTALHGYLRAVCTKHNIVVPEGSGITQLFKAIRKEHLGFVEQGARANDVGRISQAMATIIDSLNPLRNQATNVHPNDAVLEEAEAMLVINAVRCLLQYLNAKLE